MILSTEKIKQLVHDESKNPRDRIAIVPVLNWETQAKPGNCAIDVRLGQKFKVPRKAKLEKLDHLSAEHESMVSRHMDDHFVQMGDYFVLHPRQFTLGETLEWVHLPKGYACYVIGRSSWGRDGLIIATATGVHAGYSGILTLEITNVGEIPIFLWPGLTIAQLFIHTVEHGDEDFEIHRSTYAGSTVSSSGITYGPDRDIIDYFRQKLRRQK